MLIQHFPYIIPSPVNQTTCRRGGHLSLSSFLLLPLPNPSSSSLLPNIVSHFKGRILLLIICWSVVKTCSYRKQITEKNIKRKIRQWTKLMLLGLDISLSTHIIKSPSSNKKEGVQESINIPPSTQTKKNLIFLSTKIDFE